MATLKDVARLANVNASTVSRVLHGGNANVTEETRARILAASESLQYKVNAAARSLRTRSSGALGLVIPDVANPTYGQIIAGADTAARAHGFNIFLLNAATHTDQDSYLTMVQEGRVDGLILANAGLHDGLIARLEAGRLPFILVNRRTMGGAPYVVADDAAAAGLEIDHLVGLGHRRIGYLSGPLGFDTAVTRLRGARAAIAAAGLDEHRDLVLAECDYSGARVDEAVRTLLQEHPEITAFAGANFLIAMASIKALHSLGRRIPEEVSVIGQDDTPIAELCVPALTTIRTPLVGIGARAVELLIGRLRGEALPSEILRDPAPELILRDSTAPPPSLIL